MRPSIDATSRAIAQETPIPPTTAPLSIRDAAPPSPEPRVQFGPLGFACTAYQVDELKPNERLEECYRDDAQCEHVRSLIVKHRLAVSACWPIERAICFEVFKPRLMASLSRCFVSDAVCAIYRDKTLDYDREFVLRLDCTPTL